MNEYDSNRILDKVKGIDYIKTSNIDEADCYILNTCHIREKASEKVFSELGRLKKILGICPHWMKSGMGTYRLGSVCPSIHLSV